MYTKKNLPKSQHELSTGNVDKRFTRDNDIRRDDDTLKELSIGLYDLDYTIKWYFDNVIQPTTREFGKNVPVPVMYGAPEKWKNFQADGYFRDKEGKIQSPLIAYRRTGITPNKTLGSKVDANFPQMYFTEEVKYGRQNRYDQFSKLANLKPSRTFVTTVIPEFVDITYDVLVWTDFIDQMNPIVESVLYSQGSFWGDPDKFRFRTKVDNFTNTTDLMQDQDRVIRTTFTITMYGYIVPDVLVKNLSKKQSSKVIDTKQLSIETTVDADPTVFQQTDELSAGFGVQVDIVVPTTAPNPNALTSGNPLLLAYLNTNIAKQATSISVPDTAIFTAAFLSAPSGLPATSILNFIFFVNGQYVESTAITSFVDNGNGTCTLVFNVGLLGFTLIGSDEVIAIGKFA
jgi:hypothetical protein